MSMKKSRLILMVISCLVIAGGCMRSQSTYYVDPSGDDSRDGTSPDKAWRTLSKVNSVSYSPGDQVLLKRGGKWQETLRLTSSGASGVPIVYADYGTGPKPVIDLGSSLPGWSSSGNWTNRGANRWSISLGWWPGRMWFNGVEYGCPGFAVDENGNGLTSAFVYQYGSNVTNARYRWWWNGGTLYVYSTGNPASTYSSIEIGKASNGISNSWSGKSNITFKNLEIRRGESCIIIDNCDYLTWDSCKVTQMSRWGIWVKSGSDHGTLTNHCSIDRDDTVMHQMEYSGSESKGNSQDGIAIQNGSYWDIGYTYFGGTSHSGIQITGEPTGGGYNSNYNKVHDCEFNGSGDYCRAFLCQGYNPNNPDDSTAVWFCHDNEFYRNYIHNMTVVSDVGSINCKVYYNIFADQGRIWWDDLRPGFAPGEQIWRGTMLEPSSVYPTYRLQVFNNTFYTAKGSAYRFWAGSKHGYNSFKNNIIHNAGSIADSDYSGQWACPWTSLEIWPGVSKDTIQNNIIYSPSSTTTIALYQETWGNGWTPRSVAYMEANPGPNVISGNIAKDPRMLPDFHISITSPARDAGVNVGLNMDYFGTPVSHPKPDIGACEASSSSQMQVEETPQIPGGFVLEQNYPNPFNPTTVIRYAVPRESRVMLEVFNILGQSVAKLVDEVRTSGTYEARFDGHALASGTYIYRLQTDGQAPLVRKMSVMK